MANGVIIPTNKQPKIYRFDKNLTIDQAWGSLFYTYETINITDAGDLTTKDVFISFEGGYGYSVLTSLDQVSAASISVSYMRATTGYAAGTLVVYVYDR